ncbi:MAG: hypothetical protein GY699_18315 [Desulfobacteraceae bacterium]|nr:hypothetical protein [Desulfobacteraceae bacterium]
MKIKLLRLICFIIILPWIFGFGEANHDAISVSLINLIATPEKYHDKTIRVIGVSNIAFEGNSIYLSKEHWANFVMKNAIWITPNYKAIGKTEKELSEFNGRYVLIEGVFNKNDNGHMGLFSGSIDNVTRFQPVPPDILKNKRKTG